MSILKTAWANLQDGLGNRFSWSHVKAIFYNYAEHKLLSTKLDEMDALIDAKIAKAMMSSVQVNDKSKVPTSALAYSMSQEISQNEQNIATLNSNLGVIKSSDAGPDEIPTSQWYALQNQLELDAGTYVITGSLSGAGEQAGKYTGFQFFNETDNVEFGNRELACNPDGNTFGAVSTFCHTFGKKTNITMRCWTAVGYKLNGSSLKATKLK